MGNLWAYIEFNFNLSTGIKIEHLNKPLKTTMVF